ARELTGAFVDIWAELLERMRELPVARPSSAADVARETAFPVPAQPLGVQELTDLLRPLVLERSTLCGHPGFMAYVSGSGTVPGAAADLLASALNPARDAKAGADVRRNGLGGLRLVLYTSEEAHATIAEAADLLGLGERAARAIP